MKIENLEVGQVVKNYKELCELLEIEKTGGNKKKAQLKELERYVKYHRNITKNGKQGYQFIIDEIYDIPLPPNNNMTQYIPMIEKLILHIIIKESDKNNRLYIRKNSLLELLSMINNEYSEMKYKQMKLSKSMMIPKQTIIDFYSSSDNLLKRNLETALNSLVNQSLIQWNYVFTVNEVEVDYNMNKIAEPEVTQYKKVDEDGDIINTYGIALNRVKHNVREATKEETEYILRLQRNKLDEMDCKGISDVFKMGKQDYFYNSIYDTLMKERNISMYYNSYAIIYNYDHIIKQYKKLDGFILDDDEELELHMSLNDEIINKVYELSSNRHHEAMSSIENNSKMDARRSKRYVNDSNRLTQRLIKYPYFQLIHNDKQ